jgi:hypothetical protein
MSDSDGSEDGVSEGGAAGLARSAAAKERIMRRVDWRILPLLNLMYVISYLDRYGRPPAPMTCRPLPPLS